MNHGSLSVLAHAIGMSREDLAAYFNVAPRTAERWLKGHATIPDDVAGGMLAMDRAMSNAVLQVLGEVEDEWSGLKATPVYVRLEDVALYLPEWPWRKASIALVARIRASLQLIGVDLDVVSFEGGGFENWREERGLEDTQVARTAWAAEVAREKAGGWSGENE